MGIVNWMGLSISILENRAITRPFLTVRSGANAIMFQKTNIDWSVEMTDRDRVLAAFDTMDQRRKSEYLQLGEALAKARPEKRPKPKKLLLVVNNRTG
jgi:hypothetical protein